MVGLYCCVPVAWLFVFFRDSFITHNNMFRWGDCRLVNCSLDDNFSTIIIEGIPKYFNSQVLQRGEEDVSWLQELGTLRFDMAFNVALIWIITLIALSRGNQSYGKVCYLVFLVPVLCYLVVALYLISSARDTPLAADTLTSFSDFFMNSRSWMAASREVFLVWGFHGAVLQQMAAHNKRSHPLQRDTTLLWVVTSVVLVVAAAAGLSCVAGLRQRDLAYTPSSFETTKRAQFLVERQEPTQQENVWQTQLGPLSPTRTANFHYHDNFYAGIRIRPPILRTMAGMRSSNAPSPPSGYQSLRIATELFPALLAVNGAQQISPFWSSLFYLSLLLFGIAQQLAVWRTVVEAVICINRKRLQGWETFITFLCCLFGFSAALPMATGAGIHILYFLDYVVSCGWWLMILQLVQIFALLFVRGKPYSGQDIVRELMGRQDQCRSLWLGSLTSFSWNIIVPVGLLVLSISSFKSGQFKEVFAWTSSPYWPTWVCQLAAALQLAPILLVPLVGLVQTCRYLALTDADLFERIQLLYRPSLLQQVRVGGSVTSHSEGNDREEEGGEGGEDSEASLTPRPYSDPPPKYTPPPSYSTATGARFAKLLNSSVRNSMRRLRSTLRAAPPSTTEGQGAAQRDPESSTAPQPTPYIPPPDYTTSPPQYSTLDPLRRQQALAALGTAAAPPPSACVKVEDEARAAQASGTQQMQPQTSHSPSSPLHRSSFRRSSFRRSFASGVRRSARRLAASLGMRGGEDGAWLVLGGDGEAGASGGAGGAGLTGAARQSQSQPFVYTNIELLSHSHA
ncbi:sodium-dependent transporter bedraggled-like isoform X1 [Scylla paramamosain]|uniref:sodium-dependent transporter bedraggled-like isoform X1 n=1 Tax=Scylla paramamosain TaxID=85552 RepID=UPI0030837F23